MIICKRSFFHAASHGKTSSRDECTTVDLPNRNVITLFFTATYDKFVGFVVFLTRFEAKSWFTPRCNWAWTADWRTSFTTTMRVTVRAHDRSTYSWTFAHPT